MINAVIAKNPWNLKPFEDSYRYDEHENLIVVADGITRDPIRMPVLPERKDYIGWLRFF